LLPMVLLIHSLFSPSSAPIRYNVVLRECACAWELFSKLWQCWRY
jgi:hypothetical protein